MTVCSLPKTSLFPAPQSNVSVSSWGSIETVPQQVFLHHDCNGMQIHVQCALMIPCSQNDANVYADNQLSHPDSRILFTVHSPCVIG